MFRIVCTLALAVGVVSLLPGCGSSGPAVAEVEGTLLGPDGKPMPNILIQFNPDESTGQKVLASSAVTDSAGKFVLKCDDGRAGAVTGPHRVVLIDNALNTEDEPDGKKGSRPKIVNRIPPSYMSPTSTPLHIKVETAKKDYALKLERLTP